MSRRRIVIVEDEADMAELIAMRLKREHYEVTVCNDGPGALETILSDPPDLVVLDLMLPEMSGTEITTRLRADRRTAGVAIIMLTALSEESDIVVGLHVGADDYMTKPFSMSVLVARISALLRRAQSRQAGADTLSAGPIEIDPERHRVQVDGRDLTLTLTEFRLLTAIVRAGGRVLQRDQLIEAAMGSEAIVVDRTIDVHMTALRKKLGPARKYIRTVRGVGYTLAGDENTS
ncbi:MAG: response regulator transcription factor [Phycisphaerae bacterium]|jgi:two-component system phosphate regulon response regulator PhoB|nr:response regulator transcription factor [Phycisphaerae bacterium]